MRKSLFRKLFLVHVGILAASVVLIAAALSLLYTRSAYGQKRQTLDSAAKLAGATVNAFLEGSINEDVMRREIDGIGYMTDSRVYVLQYDQDTLSDLVENLADLAGTGTDSQLIRDLGTLLTGKQVFRSRQYSQELDTDVLLAGYPLVIGSSVKGGIVMVAPLEQVRRNVISISLIIGGVAIVTMLVGSLLILSVSRRISGPVRQMQEAATELASGNNPTPIPVSGEDEISQLSQAFNRMQQQLAQTERIRRAFVAHVSHELRTPLTSIQGFLQGMLDGVGKPEERQQHLEIVMREVQRLRSLTTDILDLAKLQSGTVTLNRGQSDLSELARQAVQSLSVLAREKKIRMETACDTPAPVWADAGRLNQVLVNLIGNALKYTPEGGYVLVSTRCDANTAELLVRDNGIGIPQAERLRIFDKFHRVDPSGHPALGGTGLGLNIARTIVELHHGTIEANESPEGGTDMRVCLPATRPARPE